MKGRKVSITVPIEGTPYHIRHDEVCWSLLTDKVTKKGVTTQKIIGYYPNLIYCLNDLLETILIRGNASSVDVLQSEIKVATQTVQALGDKLMDNWEQYFKESSVLEDDMDEEDEVEESDGLDEME